MARHFLFRLLTLLFGIVYLGSACELDAQEYRQHYAHETHDYLPEAAGIEVPAPEAQPATPAVQPERLGATDRPRLRFRGLPGSPAAWPWVANPPPPVRRLYLRYAVLQV
ncbi:hypothetical protein HNQ93_004092 [Hymenobacter luteus]|uniref:Uncharacterized protein n=2 Tax=Hymenobacter TaxID=89966 RepID=A0A7W9T4Z4_9BACT|nr:MULTISPECIES: hypothetical protein [Hymenobacter]MBB4603433.1 hypothetical protein [Hymenobacter latericoloratus]MBB6061213.1 hypothetical protein [Hymenobacter luteus]